MKARPMLIRTAAGLTAAAGVTAALLLPSEPEPEAPAPEPAVPATSPAEPDPEPAPADPVPRPDPTPEPRVLEPAPEPDPTAAAEPDVPKDGRLNGEWAYYALTDGAWSYRATFLIRDSALADSGYAMVVSDLMRSRWESPRGFGRIAVDENGWRFDGDWGDDGVYTFEVRRVAPGVFYGASWPRANPADRTSGLLVYAEAPGG